MQALSLQDKSTQRPYIHTSDTAVLQIHSIQADMFLPDVFQLTDGRVCRISGASTASMERTCYAVDILTAPNHAYGGPAAHTRVTGCAGLMYLGKSGAWELYPRERLVFSQNRHGGLTGISCQDEATKRAAALKLIALSDELNRDYYDCVSAGQGIKCGRWRIKPLGIQPGDPYPNKILPGSVRVRCCHQRHFLATLQEDGPKAYTVRVIVEAWDYGGGVELRAHVASIAGESLDVKPKVPCAVLNACLSRCSVG